MKIVKWKIYTGFVGASYSGDLEVEDNTTEAEINDMIIEEVWNHIEFDWHFDGDGEEI